MAYSIVLKRVYGDKSKNKRGHYKFSHNTKLRKLIEAIVRDHDSSHKGKYPNDIAVKLIYTGMNLHYSFQVSSPEELGTKLYQKLTQSKNKAI